MVQESSQVLDLPKKEAFIYELIAGGFIPDFLIRMGIMNMLGQKIQDETKATFELQQAHIMAMVEELKASPIAIETDAANEQHYQVHTEFFNFVWANVSNIAAPITPPVIPP